MGLPRRVAIVQPAVPHYRVPFFTRLISAAGEEGIHIDVFAGEAPIGTRGRGDSSDAPFVNWLDTQEFKIRGRALFYKVTAPVRRGEYDLVILEHAVRNIEAYELLMRLGGRRIAFWGHGRTYTVDVSPYQESLKYWLARQATWFFAYTQRGADSVIGRGFPPDRITVLNNSIDTNALKADLSTISDAEVLRYSRQYDLRGRTALYLGALDTYKRIPFLLDSAAIASRMSSDFRLLIAGNGLDRPITEDFVERNPWASYLGTAIGRDKALALKAAQAVAIPGAIGLVALDSLVAGKPVITTDFRHHGPEFDYLEDGSTAMVTTDDVASYATGLVGFLADRTRQKEMSDRCLVEAQKYTLDRMINSFLEGIRSALA